MNVRCSQDMFGYFVLSRKIENHSRHANVIGDFGNNLDIKPT